MVLNKLSDIAFVRDTICRHVSSTLLIPNHLWSSFPDDLDMETPRRNFKAHLGKALTIPADTAGLDAPFMEGYPTRPRWIGQEPMAAPVRLSNCMQAFRHWSP